MSQDVECAQRFSTWFAWHLSNNDFKWTWNDWADLVQFSEDDPRRLFGEEVLEKCVRCVCVAR
jgi:nuclear cap-binding protein subunit 1